jgi:hypothetical protein
MNDPEIEKQYQALYGRRPVEELKRLRAMIAGDARDSRAMFIDSLRALAGHTPVQREKAEVEEGTHD